MNDISKDKDYQEFFAGIKELAIFQYKAVTI